MRIVHTVDCAIWNEKTGRRDYVQKQITHKFRLTEKGCAKILSKGKVKPTLVLRVHASVYAS